VGRRNEPLQLISVGPERALVQVKM
jgi:hypothetical protein